MKEDARKLIELHEMLNSHEWVKVSNSFQICKCGMCRGSKDAFRQRAVVTTGGRFGRRRRTTRPHVTNPTDWKTLSEVTQEYDWVKAKAAYVERIKDYLIQFPYWAGVYGRRTGSVELIETMKQDPELLLNHCLQTKDFSEENEAKMRDSLPRLISFLKAKKEKADKRIKVSDESRQSILLNGGECDAFELARVEGPSEDTRVKVCIPEGRYIDDYAIQVDEVHSDRMLTVLLQQTVKDPLNATGAVGYLENYASNFKLLHDPRVKEAMFVTPPGVHVWVRAIRCQEQNESVRDKCYAEALNKLLEKDRIKEDDRIPGLMLDMVKCYNAKLTPEILRIVVRRGWGGTDIPIPNEFDKAIWDEAIKLGNDHRMMKDYLSKWKQYLRLNWTRDIKNLEDETREFKKSGRYEEAKVASAKCAEVKRWAHGLLVQYKTVFPQVSKED